MNPILLTDSYKVTHKDQYPPGTQRIYSYWESRGGQFVYVIFFGLQYFIKEYLTRRITRDNIEEAADVFSQHFGSEELFNREGWEYILNQHGGCFPVVIRAVPEGTPVPFRNVMLTIENTDPRCYWLVNYLETLLCHLWYPCTVATLSREIKKAIFRSLERTGDPALIPFKLHDFGCRGVSSMESAALGGAAHLVNFMGTDTIPALAFARKYYGCDMAGFSIPATEHSTITSWGRDGEVDAFRNVIQLYGNANLAGGAYACVSDSFDFHFACKELWGTTLHNEVLAAKNTLVVRPDSGDVRKVPLDGIRILGDMFGYETNSKGFKVLNSKVRLIQGDGVNFHTILECLDVLNNAGWSTDNIAFGCGGALLQQSTRDTQKFAFKCSQAVVDGHTINVFKDPATDHGKSSKKGRLVLKSGEYNEPKTIEFLGDAVMSPGCSPLADDDILQEVYRNGELIVETSFEDVRARAAI